MKARKMKEIREISHSDLGKSIQEIGMGIFAIKSKCAVQKTHAKSDVIKKMKKERARMLTALREMKDVKGEKHE